MFTGMPTIELAGTTAEMVRSTARRRGANRVRPRIWPPGFTITPTIPKMAVGRRAREVAWQKYDRKAIAEEMAAVFEESLRTSRSG
jgi:hypothetical protein